MGCLPWIIGLATALIVSALPGPGWLPLLLGIAALLITITVIAVVKQNEKGPDEKPPRPPPVPPKPSPPIVFIDETPTGSTRATIDIEDLLDAVTNEPLDAKRGIHQCPSCKLCYHSYSIEFLRQENQGKCINPLCKSTQFVPVTVTNLPRSGVSFDPDAVTINNYRQFNGRMVTFEGYVRRIDASKTGSSFAIMFEDTAWTKGLKAVVLAQYISDVGGHGFLRDLRGHRVRVRGLLKEHPLFGPQILITRRSMILEVK